MPHRWRRPTPHLAFAALLAAGLAGIDEKLELEPVFVGDAYHAKNIREVPKTLREAIDLLDRSMMLRTASATMSSNTTSTPPAGRSPSTTAVLRTGS